MSVLSAPDPSFSNQPAPSPMSVSSAQVFSNQSSHASVLSTPDIGLVDLKNIHKLTSKERVDLLTNSYLPPKHWIPPLRKCGSKGPVNIYWGVGTGAFQIFSSKKVYVLSQEVTKKLMSYIR